MCFRSAEAAKKAMKVLGIIHRQFKDLDKECFVILYKSFVRPHLVLLFKPGHLILRGISSAWKKFSVEPPKLLKDLNHSAMKADCINWD